MLFGLTVLLLFSDVAVVARVFVNTSSRGTRATVGEVCGIGDVKKKERQTTIIGDLTPACGCADATLVLATTAPAFRHQVGIRTHNLWQTS